MFVCVCVCACVRACVCVCERERVGVENDIKMCERAERANERVAEYHQKRLAAGQTLCAILSMTILLVILEN